MPIRDIRNNSREEVGIDLSESIPNTSESEKERLHQLGHDYAAFQQQGSAWKKAKYETLAEIGQIAVNKSDDIDSLKDLEKLPHITVTEVENLREHLINRQ